MFCVNTFWFRNADTGLVKEGAHLPNEICRHPSGLPSMEAPPERSPERLGGLTLPLPVGLGEERLREVHISSFLDTTDP